jgi:hypothetical protein
MAHEYVEEPPPNIWDSVKELSMLHPVLHAALVRVKMTTNAKERQSK